MADQDSLAYLRGVLANSTSGTIMLEMAFANSHDERLALVERAVDWSVQELVKNRHVKQKMTEDGLSIEIVGFLKAMGFDAGHDTQYGGHCDIIVEANRDFLWIAEAKIHKDYDWLLGGFEQLDRRYSTGLPGQDSGEMIIYCFGQRADLVLAEYQARQGCHLRWRDHRRTVPALDPCAHQYGTGVPGSAYDRAVAFRSDQMSWWPGRGRRVEEINC